MKLSYRLHSVIIFSSSKMIIRIIRDKLKLGNLHYRKHTFEFRLRKCWSTTQ